MKIHNAYIKKPLVFASLFLIACSFFLSACGSEKNKSVRAHQGSQITAPVTTPVDQAGMLNPMEAHLRARKMVDPTDTRPTHSYTRLVGEPPPAVLESSTLTSQPTSLMPAVEANVPLPGRKPLIAQVNTSAPALADGRSFMPPVTKIIAPYPAMKPVSKPIYETSENNSVQTQSQESKASPSQNSSAMDISVNEMRLGSYPDKTRVVFDLSDKAGLEYKLSPDNMRLTITIPGASWRPSTSEALAQDSIISGYRAQQTAEGTFIDFSLKKAANLSKWAFLPPDQGLPPRIYFDLKPR